MKKISKAPSGKTGDTVSPQDEAKTPAPGIVINPPLIRHEVQAKVVADVQAVTLNVRLVPNPDPSAGAGAMLMSFENSLMPISFKPILGIGQNDGNSEAHFEALEHDLANTRISLQAIIEEQVASNQDLRLSNEEMQSTNEELQSTNEELETSKEELQSVNEELITVNAELQAKIEQLSNMQNDMKNLLNSIRIGTIFLDRQLLIRRFNRDATNVYRLLASDVGRPLSDIKSNMLDEDVLEQAKNVLEMLTPYEREVETDQGAWYLARIQPYRTIDNVIDGVVLTFDDISKRVTAETAVRLSHEKDTGVISSLVVLDEVLNVIYASHAFYQDFQVTPHNTVGRKIYDLGNRQWNLPPLRELLETVLPRNQTFDGYVVEHDFPTIGRRKMQLSARRIINKAGEPQLILLSIENLI